MKRVGIWTTLLGLASLAFARNARAEVVATPNAIPDSAVSVAYDAPSNCPEASVFMERLHVRSAHVDLAPRPGAARLTVVVSSTDTTTSARIQFIGTDGLPAARTVTGRTCDEVVSAAALISALAIEASLSSAPPVPVDPRESSATKLPSPAPPPFPSSELPSRWLRGWGLGGSGGLDSWTPGAGIAWGAFGEFAARAPFDLVRLTVRGTNDSNSVDTRSATFTSLTAQLAVCPLSFRIGAPFLLLPCGAMEMGRLAGKGEASSELTTPRSAAIFWSAAEGMLLAQWHAGAWVVLEAGGELGFPLIRHTFVLDGPTQVVYEVPAIGAGAHLALALRFH